MFKRTIVLSRARVLNSRNFPVIFLLISLSPRGTVEFGAKPAGYPPRPGKWPNSGAKPAGYPTRPGKRRHSWAKPVGWPSRPGKRPNSGANAVRCHSRPGKWPNTGARRAEARRSGARFFRAEALQNDRVALG